jgi:hypothetical protein
MSDLDIYLNKYNRKKLIIITVYFIILYFIKLNTN